MNEYGITAPCKGCEHRRPACHGTCELYFQFKAECEKIKHDRKEEWHRKPYSIGAVKTNWSARSFKMTRSGRIL